MRPQTYLRPSLQGQQPMPSPHRGAQVRRWAHFATAGKPNFVGILFCLIFMYFGCVNGFAQLSVNTSVTAAQLVDQLVGQGATVSNIVLNCPAGAFGVFSNGNNTNLGMTSGMMLTTGNASLAVGPNNSGSAGQINNVFISDPNLTSIEPLATNDVCILEFDFVPQCSPLTFKYVFGSEEYPEFVNGGFNDAFGFFLTGPNPLGAAFNGYNIARLPVTGTQVSIDNVNIGNNAQYYVDNGGGATIQYDGFTVQLTVSIPIIPCQSYRLKLAIADAGDYSYDSGVFFATNSLDCPPPTLSFTTTTANCLGQNAGATVIPIGGVAPYNYQWSNGAVGNTISGVPAGTYTVSVTGGAACAAPVVGSITIGQPTNTVVTASNTGPYCPGALIQLNTGIAGGTGTPTGYSWSNPGGQVFGAIANPTIANAQPANSGTYRVTVTFNNGCTATASTFVTVNAAPTMSIQGNTTFCTGQSTTLTGLGANTYIWNNGLVAQTITVNTPGTYSVTGTGNGGCTASATIGVTAQGCTEICNNGVDDDFDLLIDCADPDCAASATASNTGPYCAGANAQLQGGPAGGFQWSGPGGFLSASQNPIINNTTAANSGLYVLTVTNAQGCTATAGTTLTVNSLPTLSINGTTNFCAGQSTVLTALGANTYVWSTGANTASITVNTAGTFGVTGTNGNGCTASTSINTTVNPLPSVSISGTLAICAGQSTTLTGLGANTYAWSTGELTASIIVTTPGTYVVTGTGANGCTASAALNVTVNPLPVLGIGGNTVFCAGQSTTLNASGANTYLWSNGQNTASITVNAAGVYSVTGTGVGGCTASTSVNVSTNPLPNVTITGTGAFCAGQSTVLTASGASTYLWSTGPNTASITVNTAGTFGVTGTDGNGCTASTSINTTVNPLPNVSISGTPAICAGQSTTLTGLGASTYAWSTGELTASINVTTPGTYVVTGTDANGCTASAALNVTVNPLPVLGIGGNTVFCTGQSTTLNASGANTYLWSNGQNTASITVNAAGVYSVTGTGVGGCTASTSVNVSTNPLPNVTITGTAAFCAGQSTVLTALGANSYVWTNGANTASITVNTAATFGVTGTDGNGCTASTSINTTVNPLPNVSISGTPAICAGQSTTLTGLGANTYAWSTGELTASIIVTTPGTYVVMGTDANGCTASAALNVTVNPLPVLGIGGNTVFCAGQSTTLNATGANTYVWDNGQNTASITVNAAGVYSVTGTGVGGCTASTSVNVSTNPVPNVLISGTASFCAGQSTVLTALGANGYVWSTGANTASITVNTAATFGVTGTDGNGCTASTSINTTVNPLPNVSISGTPAICAGQSTTLAGLGAATYAWSTGELTASINVTTPGTYVVTGTDANGCTASAALNVTVNPLPVLGIGGNTVFCTGQSTTLNATGANTYVWDNGQNTASITVNAAGVYSVTGTGVGGCTASTSVNVSTNPLPNVSITGTAAFCAGQSTVLTALGANTYVWSTGANTASITVNTAGTFGVTGTDGNGCTAASSINTTIDPLPNVIIGGTTVICNGQTTTLTANGAAAYLWNNGANTPTLTVNTAGTYAVTGTSNAGCTASASVNVLTNATPLVSISGTAAFCAGQNTLLTGLGANTYVWSTGDGTASITVTTSGNYLVTGTDNNGCTASASLNVTANPLPVVSITGAPAFCSGQSIPLNANGANTYVWNNGSNAALLTVNAAGTYSVTGTGNGGCTASASFAVAVNPTPTVSISGTATFCVGQNTVLTAFGANTYTWNTGDATAALTVTATGTYAVTGTDINGCTATASLAATEQPCTEICNNLIDDDADGLIDCADSDCPVSVSISGANDFCPGGNAVLTASGASTYAWNTGENTTSIVASTAGAFSVTGTDGNGCTASASASVAIFAPPTLAISGVTTICSGATTSLTASGADNFVWSTGEATPSISVAAAGTYTVTGTDANGCTGSASATINVAAPATVSASTNAPLFCTTGTQNLLLNAAISGGLPPYQIEWTGPNGVFSPNQNAVIPNATSNDAGTYVIVVTDGNGCVTPATGIVAAITDAPAVPTINSNSPLCVGEMLMLDAVAELGVTYAWSGPGGFSANTATAAVANVVAANGGTYTLTVTNALGCTSTASLLVSVLVNPLATITSNAPLVCTNGSQDIQFTANVVGGVAPYVYTWSGPNGFSSNQNNPVVPNATAVNAGTYSLTVTAANGCSVAASSVVDITVRPSQPILAAVNNPLCTGETLNLEAVADAGVTYAWSGPGGFTLNNATGTINNVTAANGGTYTLTVTNALGCTSTASLLVSVLVNPLATITSNAPLVCTNGNQDIQFTANVVGGVAPYVYTWSGPNGFSSNQNNPVVPNATAVNAGTYSLTVTAANGCSVAASSVVAITERPNQPIPSATNNPLCTGETLTLNAVADAGVTYVWSGPAGFTLNTATGAINNVSAANSGLYVVTVTNAAGCSAAAGIAVQVLAAPQVTLSYNAPLNCANGNGDLLLAATVTGGAAPYTYQWSGPNGFASALNNPVIANATPNEAGSYNLTVTSADGCQVVGSIGVAITNAAPVPVIVGPSTACASTQATLTVSNPEPNGTYQWFFLGAPVPGAVGTQYVLDSLTSADTGAYTVALTLNGCSAVALPFTLSVSDGLTVVAANNASECMDPTADVELVAAVHGGFGPYSFQWDGIGQNGYVFQTIAQNPVLPNVINDYSGTYVVVVTDAYGCSALAFTVVDLTVAPSLPVITGTSPLCAGSTLTLSVPVFVGNTVAYTWFSPSGNILTNFGNTLTLPNANVSDAGNYRVLVTVDGCASDTATAFFVEILDTPSITGVTGGGNYCEGTTATVSVQTTGPAALFNWTGPNGFNLSNQPTGNLVLPNLSPANGGLYVVEAVAAGGCASAPFAFSLNIVPELTAPTLSLVSPVCAGSDVTISATPLGGNATYVWYANGIAVDTTALSQLTLAGVSPAQAGLYSVAVSVNGCSSPLSPLANLVVLGAPQVTATVNGPICSGETLVFDAPLNLNWDYQWTGAGGFVSSLRNPVLTGALPINSGTYYLIVTDQQTSCSAVDTLLATVNALPATPLPANSGPVCVGSDLSLYFLSGGTPGATYTWYNAATGLPVGTSNALDGQLTLSGLAVGLYEYYVVATSAAGCIGAASISTQAEVRVFELPVADAGSDIFACGDTLATLIGTLPPNASGTWSSLGLSAITSPNSPVTTVFGLENGANYFVWSISGGICPGTASDTVTVWQEGLPTANADSFFTDLNQTLVFAEVSINDDTSALIAWSMSIVENPLHGTALYNNDGTFTYQPDQNYYGPDAFVYRLCGANCPNLCDTALVVLQVGQLGDCHVPNVITPNGDGVNDWLEIPCLDIFTVNNLRVFNRWGDEVYYASPYLNDWTGTFASGDLPEGTYFYVLQYTDLDGQEVDINGYLMIHR